MTMLSPSIVYKETTLESDRRQSDRMKRPVIKLGTEKPGKRTSKPSSQRKRSIAPTPLPRELLHQQQQTLLYECPICVKPITMEGSEGHILECSRSNSTNTEKEQYTTPPFCAVQQRDDNTVIEVDNFEDHFGGTQFSEDDIRTALRKYASKDVDKTELFANDAPDRIMMLLRELQIETLKYNPPRTVRLLFAKFALALFHQQTKDRETCLRCSVCLETPTEPTVSIVCWHVLCAPCWPVTIGNKRLCPQCNSITQPSDLRRIFV